MIKHLITATLFALGFAGGALVVYLDAEPLAFTRPLLPSVAADRSPAVIPARVPVDIDSQANSIWLAEVRITAAPPRVGKQSALPVVPARFDPCSEWRDVGATFIDPAGRATGVRNVRALCAQPDVDR